MDELLKNYGPLEGRGVPGMLVRAAEVLEHHAQQTNSRSLIAENLRDAAANICAALGSFCSACGLPRPLLTVEDGEICIDCAQKRWRRKD